MPHTRRLFSLPRSVLSPPPRRCAPSARAIHPAIGRERCTRRRWCRSRSISRAMPRALRRHAQPAGGKDQGLPLLKVTVHAAEVSFYACADGADGHAVGRWQYDHRRLLRRRQHRAVQPDAHRRRRGRTGADQPAREREFEGKWSATIAASGLDAHVVLTLANRADNRAIAHLVNLDQGGLMLPLIVAQDGDVVTLTSTVVPSSFIGTISAAGDFPEPLRRALFRFPSPSIAPAIGDRHVRSVTDNNTLGRGTNGSGDSRLPGIHRGDCNRCDGGDACGAVACARTRVGDQRFVLCPCHLPVTLAIAAALLGQTPAGAALHAHPIAAGAMITATWAAATWYRFWLMREPA